MFRSSYLEHIREIVVKGPNRVRLGGLHGSARSALFLDIQNDLNRPLLIITPHTEAAETIQNDLGFFIRLHGDKKSIFSFPNWEILPYEPLSPYPEIVGERLAALDALSRGEAHFVIATAQAVLQRVMPCKALSKFSFELKKGEEMEIDLVLDCLVQAGYRSAEMVEIRGEFSVRGGVLDIFTSDSALPARLEFFGDRVESIRRFDPDTQRSVRKIDTIRVLPVRELILNASLLEAGLNELDLAVVSDADRRPVRELKKKFSNLFPFPAAENYAPYFYSEMESLFDYLPTDTVVILEEPEQIYEQHTIFEERVKGCYLDAVSRGDFPAPVAARYMEGVEASEAVNKFRLIENRLIDTEPDQAEAVSFTVKSVPSYDGRFREFADQVKKWRKQGFETTVAAPTKGQVSRIRELLVEEETDCGSVVGNLSTGFILPESKFALLTEHEIFGRTHIQRAPEGKSRGRRLFKGFKDLKLGDLVVHLDYGVGEFVGVNTLDGREHGPEFVELLYADDEKLYLPMDRLDLIQKYVGADISLVGMDKLGGASWKRNKANIRKAVLEMAQDLLKLYAARRMARGYAYSADSHMEREFEDSFEYTETPDQARAIEDVKADLQKPEPMDRLICGDVGYGKTEVAMRAAFKVVAEGKQVALLAPTTILTQQHLQTFRERLRAYPVNVDLLNRFRTPKEQRETIKKVRSGQVDILIGTHRILQKGIEFKELGLIIIDEEQRFGVRHKEKLKELRKQVDVLTLTATPIPRTLHFSMTGLRDLSIIETPPKNRLAIKTYTRKFDPVVIKEAINRELGRQGQIFFVHNRVEGIYPMADYIRRLAPHARVDVAHGQMKERGLEKVMMRFLNKEIDLLVCTTIIESGLDIPSVNTIIVNRADKFGLSQLYQLRGRVGRYKRQAYAYLLIPGELVLKDEARKRLRAIEEMSELGAGFHLATRDLEIRGAGNLLGHKQSGRISAIGYEMYVRLLEDTIKELKGEKVEETIEPDINLDYKGAIPRSYIPVLNQRLDIYRRLYTVRETAKLADIAKEVRDRFGPLPLSVKKLIALLEIKILARNAWVLEIKQKADRAVLNFHASAELDAERLAGLVSRMKGRLNARPDNRLIFETDGAGWQTHYRELVGLLKALAETTKKMTSNE